MSQEPDWMDPANLHICWLNEETKPGLFSGSGALVWVVETPDGPHGVRLTDGEGQFITWKLEPGFHLSGVHLGPVELQLDAGTIEMPDNMLQAGDLELHSDTITLIGATSPGYIRASRLPVGKLGPAQEHPLSFRCTRWSLIRTGDEERNSVFERHPNSDPS